MRIFETVASFRAACAVAKRPLGLVPTMGALHAGHRSLLDRARSDNSTLAATIFVNPTQFGPSEDYSEYPRDLKSDLAMMEETGVDLLFTPSAKEMYPEGFDTSIDVGRIAQRLEGEHRPDHFIGVATVVCKLLSIARPDRAYFGQKDAQQSLVIKRLNTDLNLGAEIVICPTVREPDGLALSSRNNYMGPPGREAATVLYRSLKLAEDLGTSDANEIRSRMRNLIGSETLASIEYVSVADAETLEELDVIDRPALVSLAVHIGATRLIDNILINSDG
ncbi:MAG: pantoate--beta-alanine ligase [Dehalococcoidia bacterium]|nr:pantoate--beta-alanine ligase [Dehalococcoidia bacterium]